MTRLEGRTEVCPVGLPWGMLEAPLLVDPGEPAGVSGGSCWFSGSTGASACTTCQHKWSLSPAIVAKHKYAHILQLICVCTPVRPTF